MEHCILDFDLKVCLEFILLENKEFKLLSRLHDL